jgi:HSP20 family protein
MQDIAKYKTKGDVKIRSFKINLEDAMNNCLKDAQKWLDAKSVLSQIDNYIQCLFLPYFDNSSSSLTLLEKTAYPRLDIRDEPDKIVVNVETPGLSKEDVKVEVNEGNLIVRGEKRKETTEDGNGLYIRKEIKKSSFSRQICKLMDNCNIDKIDASFKDGMLTIIIPKKVADKKPKIAPKSIAVK